MSFRLKQLASLTNLPFPALRNSSPVKSGTVHEQRNGSRPDAYHAMTICQRYHMNGRTLGRASGLTSRPVALLFVGAENFEIGWGNGLTGDGWQRRQAFVDLKGEWDFGRLHAWPASRSTQTARNKTWPRAVRSRASIYIYICIAFLSTSCRTNLNA